MEGCLKSGLQSLWRSRELNRLKRKTKIAKEDLQPRDTKPLQKEQSLKFYTGNFFILFSHLKYNFYWIAQKNVDFFKTKMLWPIWSFDLMFFHNMISDSHNLAEKIMKNFRKPNLMNLKFDLLTAEVTSKVHGLNLNIQLQLRGWTDHL